MTCGNSVLDRAAKACRRRQFLWWGPGAIRNGVTLRAIAVPLSLAATAGLLLLSGCGVAHRTEPLTTVSLIHGPFEIVASGRRISTGAFPNISGDPFATMEVTAFSVRHRGQDVAVPRVGTQFWRVLRLMDAPLPALLVATTDFHVITEADGQPVVRSFGEPTSGMAEAQWLDAAGGQPGPARTFGIEKVAAEDGTRMQGGQWLLLSSRTVLDVKALKAYPVNPWIESGRGEPLEGLNAGGITARAFSPGRSQYVMPASAIDPTTDRRYDGLLIVDIPSGKAYGRRLDRKRTRYTNVYDIDAAWIDHHFEWRIDNDGLEHFVERGTFRPWPWRGKRVNTGSVEYHVPRAKPEMADHLRAFLQQRFDARVAPDWLEPTKTSGHTFTVPGCDHIIVLGHGDHDVSLFVPRADTTPWVRCQDTVNAIGDAFDAELATGRFDDAFDSAE